MIAFLVTAFIGGFIVVYVIPKVNSWIAQVPGSDRIVNNKFGQLLIVGVVLIFTLHLFGAIARKVE